MESKINELISKIYEVQKEASDMAAEYKVSIFHTDRDAAITGYALHKMSQLLKEAATVYDEEIEKEVVRKHGAEIVAP